MLCVALCAAGYTGLLLAPGSATYVWCLLFGFGQGAPLALALGYIVARVPDSHHAAQLSTMAQSVGYLIAAAGPFAMGALHGATGSWKLPIVMLLVLARADAADRAGGVPEPVRAGSQPRLSERYALMRSRAGSIRQRRATCSSWSFIAQPSGRSSPSNVGAGALQRHRAGVVADLADRLESSALRRCSAGSAASSARLCSTGRACGPAS